MPVHRSEHIGEMDIRWVWLLKLTLVAVPVLTSLFTAAFIPWSVWVTGAIYTSQAQAATLEKIVIEVERMHNEIEQLPPPEWKDRIRKLEESTNANFRDHEAIKISLEQIKAKLGVPNPPSG